MQGYNYKVSCSFTSAPHHCIALSDGCTKDTHTETSPVAYPGIFLVGVEDRGQRGRGSGGGSPVVRGSGGSCNLVQEISFHMVKCS